MTGTRNAAEIQVSCDALVPRSSWKSPLSTAGMANAACARAIAAAAAISVRLSRTYLSATCPVTSVLWVKGGTFPSRGGGVDDAAQLSAKLITAILTV
ncbi:hypothetical protein [Gordonia polyisoprenivorans]|uniref:hypothetical protein n=1 Tax=Gordonia polyisoprenivorans TaxID=84595 RepID=UPI001E52A15C|nr:hypothetical protein [Gordonia polyisoprenivorans]